MISSIFQNIYLISTIRKVYVLIFLIIFSSCAILNKNIPNTPNTQSQNWKTIPTFQNFVSPWDEQAFGKTTFQYQNDTDWFYFLFDVVDNDIQLCDTSLNNELNAVQSDRVELFFTKDSLMQPYYTFEMDAAGRLFDARCSILPKNINKPEHLKHRKQINSDWHIDKNGLLFKATKTKRGYKVEGKIAMSFLKNNDLITNSKLWCGIQRADFNAKGPTQWICVIDPKTIKPDFHNWGVFVELSVLQ